MRNTIRWVTYSTETIFKRKHADNFKNIELKLRQECLKRTKESMQVMHDFVNALQDARTHILGKTLQNLRKIFPSEAEVILRDVQVSQYSCP